jgi:Ca2+-binding RTX toxin-like protein
MNARVRIGRVSRIFVLASTALAALLLGAAASASAGTLDQQQTSSNTNVGLTSNQSAAQTFTAGLSGVLDQADLKLSKLGTPPDPVNVEIRDTSAGIPGTTVLSTGTIPTSAITTTGTGEFASVTFATPALVTAGTLYALVAYAPGTGSDVVGWLDQSGGDPYPSGGYFFSSGPIPPGGSWTGNPANDYAFKTYVGPAPPQSSGSSGGSGGSTALTCKGQQTTIVGTEGNDVRSGTPGRDVMVGLGGNDSLSGLGGNDLICGGSGKDKLRGGAGNDKLLGEAGKDTLKGDGAKDICKGGKGNDSGKCEVEKSL